MSGASEKPLLLLDIGNSRIKAARWQAGVLGALPTVAHQGDAAAALLQIAGAETPGAIWISHVLGAAAEAAMTESVKSHWRQAPHYARSEAERLGLRNAYREPTRLGVDRWLAMLGAWHRDRRAAVVVDAGTALTADGIDAQGQHRGGFIAPGLLTAQRAVLGATRFATRDSQATYTAGLGHDTEACVRQGAFLGCLGAIDRAVAQLDSGASTLITGGDAPTLLPQLGAGWQHRPLLVLEGLLALALDGPG